MLDEYTRCIGLMGCQRWFVRRSSAISAGVPDAMIWAW